MEGYLMEDYRLDLFLQSKGFTESREKAKQLILGNCVYVNERAATKPSIKVTELDKIEVRNNFEYVSRGASKLEKAVSYFRISLNNAVAADIGASTGGFTDYLIKNHAKKVYAVDVGHGQLHESLRNDKRVINLEGINFRYADTSIIDDEIDVITADVSFISLQLILPKISEISRENTDIIVLIKPQFEAGRENIGKKGVVKDKNVHIQVLNKIQSYCSENGLILTDVTFSPIRGGDGNIEYLGHIKRFSEGSSFLNETKFKDLVIQAFEYYKNNRNV